MNLKTVRIILGSNGPGGVLPGDVIQGTVTGIRYLIKRVAYDKISNVYWYEAETKKLKNVTDTGFILVKASEFAPWYSEVCKTCVTKDSCDLCSRLTGWTTKKFAYIGDKIEFFGSTEVVEELGTDEIMSDELTITTDRSSELLISDPEVKVIERGPWMCYRAETSPNYLSHCSVCLHPRCSECFFQKLRENQS